MIGSDVTEIAPVYHVEMPGPLRTPSGLMYTIVLISDMGRGVCCAKPWCTTPPTCSNTPCHYLCISVVVLWLCIAIRCETVRMEKSHRKTGFLRDFFHIFLKLNYNKNAFQWDAYHPLVDRIPACTGWGECVSQHSLGRGCAGGAVCLGVSAWKCLPRGVSAQVSAQGVWQTPPREQNDRQV